MKSIEDYEDLFNWCEDHYSNHAGCGYPQFKTEEKLLELAQQLESIDAWNSQLEKASARVKELEQENKELKLELSNLQQKVYDHNCKVIGAVRDKKTKQ
jgi:predicted RNase H-like nuclease (RuvC/YqgF family)